jgi:hypothetical protein
MLRNSSSRPCGPHPSDQTTLWMGGPRNRARAPGSPSHLLLLLMLLLPPLPLPLCTRLQRWGLNIPATFPQTLVFSMRCCASSVAWALRGGVGIGIGREVGWRRVIDLGQT